MRVRSLVFLALISVLLPATTLADDWPQWRGPSRDGISQETGLLQEWPKEGPAQFWQVTDVGSGYSTPSIVGDRIYLLGNEGLEKEFVQCRSTEDGSIIWSRTIGKVGENTRPKYPAARSTPTVVGDRLYALGSDGDLACLAIDDGSVIWKKNLRTDFGGKHGNWAYAESPLVDGQAVVCTPGGADATIIKLDRTNGEVIWKSPLPKKDEAAYASIVVMNTGATRQYVQLLQHGLVGVDAATGKLLWRYGRTAEGSPANIPTPVINENLVYTATARGGSALVAIEESDDGVAADEVYHSPRLPDNIGGSIEHDGHLYGTTRQGLLCVDFKSGDVVWQDRAIGAASTLFADGLLFLHGENGEVALVAANPESYQELGRFTPAKAPDPGKAKTWAYPVLADGKLYIRQENSLWCYDVAK